MFFKCLISLILLLLMTSCAGDSGSFWGAPENFGVIDPHKPDS